jgi:hypothetical protein
MTIEELHLEWLEWVKPLMSTTSKTDLAWLAWLKSHNICRDRLMGFRPILDIQQEYYKDKSK